METSLFLARLMGPAAIVMGAAMLINPVNMREMANDFLEHRGLIFLAGILTLVAGLAIVLTHNVWVAGWPVIITIIGWSSCPTPKKEEQVRELFQDRRQC